MNGSLTHAMEYIVGSQGDDGSWGSGDPFTCARALYALRDDIPEDTLARGLRYLEGCQAQDGHFAGRTKMYSDASNTAYTMIVLNRFDYGKASMPISRGILWLLENQQDDGSWGPNKKKKAYTTSMCLRALHTFYLSGLARYAKGLAYVDAYLDTPDLEKEPVSHVYAPVLNLKRIGALDDGVEKRFLEYAGSRAKGAMDSGSVADVSYLLGTLKALGEAGLSPILEEWLMAAQNEDGGYGKDLSSASDPHWTALAVLAIQNRL